jgi:flagellar motor switch protein FliM
MTPDPFDFRKPPPGVLEWQTAEWLAEAARLASITWSKLLTFQAEPSAGGVVPTTAGDGLATLPANALGFPVMSETDPGDGFLLAVPRPLVLTLLAGLMNEVVTALVPDRDLTALESSLCGFLARELFLNPMTAAWPLDDPPRWAAGAGGLPRNVWRVAAADPAVLASFMVNTPFGELPFYLLFMRSVRLLRLADPPPMKASPLVPAERQHIESLVREMTVDVDVTLGTAELTLYDLAKLRSGDVLMLRQKVSDPLTASVAGTPKFRVWPGAVGGRQAVQVHAPAEAA